MPINPAVLVADDLAVGHVFNAANDFAIAVTSDVAIRSLGDRADDSPAGIADDLIVAKGRGQRGKNKEQNAK